MLAKLDRQPWYICAFIGYSQAGVSAEDCVDCHEWWMLLRAGSPESAYVKASRLAGVTIRRVMSPSEHPWEIAGITELLLTIDEPASGSELTWEPRDVSLEQLDRLVRQKLELSAFRSTATTPEAGWYVAALVYLEVYDTPGVRKSGSVWINHHLFNAKDAEAAYAQASTLGREYAAVGAHTRDGQRAHFDFKGLQELVQAIEAPADGAVLWSEPLHLSRRELKSSIPPKSDLGVFSKGADGGG